MIARLLHVALGSGPRLLVTIVVNLLGCAALLVLFEGTRAFESVYWAVTTGSTVGYGDISPASAPGQVTAMWLMVSSTAFVALGTAMLAARLVQDPHLFSHHEQEELKDDIDDVHEMLYLVCEKLGIEVPESVEEYHARRVAAGRSEGDTGVSAG